MDLSSLDSWQSVARALIATGILIVVAEVIGAVVAGKSASRPLRVIVGINCVGLLGIALGWLRQPIPLLIFLGILLAFGVLTAVKSWRSLRLPTGKSSNSPDGVNHSRATFTGTNWFTWFTWCALLITAGPALTYPSGWDELVYHIELPRRWLDEGALTVQADLPYSALPSLPEITVWLAAPVEHLVTPRLLMWIVWVNGILILRESIRQFATPMVSEVLVWSLAASRVSLMISANCYVECFLWANTAGLCSLLLTPNMNSRTRYGLAGLLAGAAMATKMTSIGLLAFLPASYLFMRTREPRVAIELLKGILVACAFAAPFYLRSWIQAGNPFSPYFASFFTSDLAALRTSEFHHGLATGNFGIAGWLGFTVAPLALAFARELYDGTFGLQWPVILCCAVLAAKHAMAEKKNQQFVAAMALCGLLYVLWFVSSQQARFGVSFLMLGVFASAGYITKLPRKPQRLVLVGLSALTFFSVPWINAGYYLDSWLCIMKIRSPIDYIRDGVGDSYAELSLYLRSEIPADSKIVTFFEHRLAYLPAGVEIATPYFQQKYFANPDAQSSPDEIMKQFELHNVKYVVLTLTPLGPDVSQQYIEAQQRWFRGIDECIANGKLTVVWRSENHAITEVKM